MVMGLGFAATRDLISFLRYDTYGRNPLFNDKEMNRRAGRSASARHRAAVFSRT